MAKKPASLSETELLVLRYFAHLPDPRYKRARKHPLMSLLFIALCAFLCGADTFAQMQRWAKAKQDWLEERIPLPHGIPSHDTIGRVFARLDNKAFAACFEAWTQALYQKTEGEVIALDGKTIRGSFDTATGSAALHLVSAWASANRLVLCQQQVEDHENEVKAVPALLKLLDIKGCVVTGDAMLTQKKIARQIIAAGGDYVLALKENHPHLYDCATDFFEYWLAQGWKTEEDGEPIAHDFAQTIGKGHGRLEIRRCHVVESVKDWLDPKGEWSGLASVARVEYETRRAGKVSSLVRYYVTSLSGEEVARTVLRCVRQHWGIENRLHWCLDVVFKEDKSQVRSTTGHAAGNLGWLRKMVLNLLRKETSVKAGLQSKRNLAGWDIRYLETILTGNPYQPDER